MSNDAAAENDGAAQQSEADFEHDTKLHEEQMEVTLDPPVDCSATCDNNNYISTSFSQEVEDNGIVDRKTEPVTDNVGRVDVEPVSAACEPPEDFSDSHDETLAMKMDYSSGEVFQCLVDASSAAHSGELEVKQSVDSNNTDDDLVRDGASGNMQNCVSPSVLDKNAASEMDRNNVLETQVTSHWRNSSDNHTTIQVEGTLASEKLPDDAAELECSGTTASVVSSVCGDAEVKTSSDAAAGVLCMTADDSSSPCVDIDLPDEGKSVELDCEMSSVDALTTCFKATAGDLSPDVVEVGCQFCLSTIEREPAPETGIPNPPPGTEATECSSSEAVVPTEASVGESNEAVSFFEVSAAPARFAETLEHATEQPDVQADDTVAAESARVESLDSVESSALMDVPLSSDGDDDRELSLGTTVCGEIVKVSTSGSVESRAHCVRNEMPSLDDVTNYVEAVAAADGNSSPDFVAVGFPYCSSTIERERASETSVANPPTGTEAMECCSTALVSEAVESCSSPICELVPESEAAEESIIPIPDGAHESRPAIRTTEPLSVLIPAFQAEDGSTLSNAELVPESEVTAEFIVSIPDVESRPANSFTELVSASVDSCSLPISGLVPESKATEESAHSGTVSDRSAVYIGVINSSYGDEPVLSGASKNLEIMEDMIYVPDLAIDANWTNEPLSVPIPESVVGKCSILPNVELVAESGVSAVSNIPILDIESRPAHISIEPLIPESEAVEGYPSAVELVHKSSATEGSTIPVLESFPECESIPVTPVVSIPKAVEGCTVPAALAFPETAAVVKSLLPISYVDRSPVEIELPEEKIASSADSYALRDKTDIRLELQSSSCDGNWNHDGTVVTDAVDSDAEAQCDKQALESNTVMAAAADNGSDGSKSAADDMERDEPEIEGEPAAATAVRGSNADDALLYDLVGSSAIDSEDASCSGDSFSSVRTENESTIEKLGGDNATEVEVSKPGTSLVSNVCSNVAVEISSDSAFRFLCTAVEKDNAVTNAQAESTINGMRSGVAMSTGDEVLSCMRSEDSVENANMSLTVTMEVVVNEDTDKNTASIAVSSETANRRGVVTSMGDEESLVSSLRTGDGLQDAVVGMELAADVAVSEDAVFRECCDDGADLASSSEFILSGEVATSVGDGDSSTCTTNNARAVTTAGSEEISVASDDKLAPSLNIELGGDSTSDKNTDVVGAVIEMSDGGVNISAADEGVVESSDLVHSGDAVSVAQSDDTSYEVRNSLDFENSLQNEGVTSAVEKDVLLCPANVADAIPNVNAVVREGSAEFDTNLEDMAQRKVLISSGDKDVAEDSENSKNCLISVSSVAENEVVISTEVSLLGGVNPCMAHSGNVNDQSTVHIGVINSSYGEDEPVLSGASENLEIMEDMISIAGSNTAYVISTTEKDADVDMKRSEVRNEATCSVTDDEGAVTIVGSDNTAPGGMMKLVEGSTSTVGVSGEACELTSTTNDAVLECRTSNSTADAETWFHSQTSSGSVEEGQFDDVESDESFEPVTPTNGRRPLYHVRPSLKPTSDVPGSLHFASPLSFAHNTASIFTFRHSASSFSVISSNRSSVPNNIPLYSPVLSSPASVGTVGRLGTRPTFLQSPVVLQHGVGLSGAGLCSVTSPHGSSSTAGNVALSSGGKARKRKHSAAHGVDGCFKRSLVGDFMRDSTAVGDQSVVAPSEYVVISSGCDTHSVPVTQTALIVGTLTASSPAGDKLLRDDGLVGDLTTVSQHAYSLPCDVHSPTDVTSVEIAESEVTSVVCDSDADKADIGCSLVAGFPLHEEVIHEAFPNCQPSLDADVGALERTVMGEKVAEGFPSIQSVVESAKASVEEKSTEYSMAASDSVTLPVDDEQPSSSIADAAKTVCLSQPPNGAEYSSSIVTDDRCSADTATASVSTAIDHQCASEYMNEKQELLTNELVRELHALDGSDLLSSQCISHVENTETFVSPSQASTNSDVDGLHLYLQLSQEPTALNISAHSHSPRMADNEVSMLSCKSSVIPDVDNLHLFLEPSQEPNSLDALNHKKSHFVAVLESTDDVSTDGENDCETADEFDIRMELRDCGISSQSTAAGLETAGEEDVDSILEATRVLTPAGPEETGGRLAAAKDKEQIISEQEAARELETVQCSDTVDEEWVDGRQDTTRCLESGDELTSAGEKLVAEEESTTALNTAAGLEFSRVDETADTRENAAEADDDVFKPNEVPWFQLSEDNGERIMMGRPVELAEEKETTDGVGTQYVETDEQFKSAVCRIADELSAVERRGLSVAHKEETDISATKWTDTADSVTVFLMTSREWKVRIYLGKPTLAHLLQLLTMKVVVILITLEMSPTRM